MNTTNMPVRAFQWRKTPLAMTLPPEARVAACRAAFASGRATPATGVLFLEALFRMAHFDEAIAFSEENPRPPGCDPAWDAALIHNLLGSGQKEKALAHANAALKMAPGCWPIVHERAELLLRLGRGAEAEADIVALLEQSHLSLTPQMSMHLKRSKEPAQLLELLDRWPGRVQPGIAPWLRVQSLLALDRRTEALEWMDVDNLLHQEVLPLPDITDRDAFHNALMQETTESGSFRYEPLDLATRKGQQTSVLLNGTTSMPVLLSAIRGAIDRYVARLLPDSPFTRSIPKAGALDAWMVRLGPGGRQAAHLHPSGWLSGVYYISAPGVDETAGALVIPYDKNPVWPVHTLVPESGKLVLFPSYFMHHTLPHRSEQQRVCVAFDVLPRGENEMTLR
ncbi:hypothetical protein GE253_23345 [Niveispirillum sp. SYP-B3756]|uniref:2OG-Fe(II) oxygenase family protein n=1 Tax=Niveispirillum sp. SYP-B3756 TaxID=2662178 RepID=UPI00129241AA|nr:putative 2OG-Fe(II) oxygenase [Niveispirillum sp. SYP-B3756]MQP68259.1 hypothetical protein [Niveispirillum sp. SYP-B3756]